MTAVRLVEIHCDADDCAVWTEPQDTSASAYRARLVHEGWTRHDGKDLCPDHPRERRR